MCAPTTPPTLREWVRAGPFSLCLSQGFFCFPALVGALRVVAECLQDEGQPRRPLQSAVHACSGSSSGALVAAFVAAGHDVAELPRLIRGLDPREVVDVFGDRGLGSGGLVAGRGTVEALRKRLGSVTMGAACQVPVAFSAFDLRRCRTVAVGGDDQDLAAGVLASSCVPGLFAPQRLADGSLVIDLAFFFDAAGAMALPSLPPSGRLLRVLSLDWNLGRLCRAPPGASDVATIELAGVTRVMPWNVATMGDRAAAEAELATLRCCDRPLRRAGPGRLVADAAGPHPDLRGVAALLLLAVVLWLIR